MTHGFHSHYHAQKATILLKQVKDVKQVNMYLCKLSVLIVRHHNKKHFVLANANFVDLVNSRIMEHSTTKLERISKIGTSRI